MKRLMVFFFILLFSRVLTAPDLNWYAAYEVFELKLHNYELQKYEKELDLFAHHLGWVESRNNWKIVNSYGYMGTWQFGEHTLKRLGLEIKPAHFRADSTLFPPELQYECLKLLIKVHTIELRRYESYIGHTIGGVYITRAGLLAGCHLGGVGGVREFLLSAGSIDRSDGYGTKISKYIQEFRLYDL